MLKRAEIIYKDVVRMVFHINKGAIVVFAFFCLGVLGGTAFAQNLPNGGGVANSTTGMPVAEPQPLPPPFELSDADQFRLNEFLDHWESFGRGIKRVSCSVHVREYDGGVLHKDSRIPMVHTWGQFRFIAPNKLFYHVKGEYTYIDQTGAEPKPEWKPSSNESKIVYDGKSLTNYDFQKKVATQYPIVEEEQNQDLSIDGPFPIFFIANAQKLKNRFYLRLVTPPEKAKTDVWVEAWPRHATDSQEFRNIILLLRLSDLQPYHMRRTRTNGKSYSDFEFQDIAVNKGLWAIDSAIDLGWKKAEEPPISLLQRRETAPAPGPASGVIQE